MAVLCSQNLSLFHSEGDTIKGRRSAQESRAQWGPEHRWTPFGRVDGVQLVYKLRI